MTFRELCKFVDAHRNIIRPSAKIGVRDHYGELEDTLEGLAVHTTTKGSFLELVGVRSKYPEPD